MKNTNPDLPRKRNKKTLLIFGTLLLILALGLPILYIHDRSRRDQMVQTLNNFRQLQIARQAMLLDQYTSGEDSNLDSAKALVENNYLTENDFKSLTAGYDIQFLPIDTSESAKDSPSIIGVGMNKRVITTQDGQIRIEDL